LDKPAIGLEQSWALGHTSHAMICHHHH
jgi:hypothetical protein